MDNLIDKRLLTLPNLERFLADPTISSDRKALRAALAPASAYPSPSRYISMILDERSYSIAPAHVGDYLDLYVSEGMAIQVGHLGTLIGWFTQDIGAVNEVVHIWQYEDLADRTRRRAAMEADPAWQAFRKKSAPYVQNMRSRILKPTWFSPLGGSGVRP